MRALLQSCEHLGECEVWEEQVPILLVDSFPAASQPRSLFFFFHPLRTFTPSHLHTRTLFSLPSSSRACDPHSHSSSSLIPPARSRSAICPRNSPPILAPACKAALDRLKVNRTPEFRPSDAPRRFAHFSELHSTLSLGRTLPVFWIPLSPHPWHFARPLSQ